MLMTMSELAQLREIGQRLAAYLPSTLVRRILRGELPVPGQARRLTAATLFSDISGFTRMAEELAADGPRGAEELNRVLLLTFTAMINVIHDAGGCVSHFHGDAMTVYFTEEEPDSAASAAIPAGIPAAIPAGIPAAIPAGIPAAMPAALRALACAQLMQRLMATTFSRMVTNRPPHKDPVFYLAMKMGVGYGRCLEMIVGDPDKSLEFVLAGPAVDEAATAQQQAGSSQVIASRAVLAGAGLPADGPFTVLQDTLPHIGSQPLIDWNALDEEALTRLRDTAVLFIPPVIARRLQAANPDFIAEHRPVTTLFVQFEGIDYESENAGALLQLYYQWVAQIVERYGAEYGRLNRVLTGDKGSQFHLIFGAPVAPDAPDQALRCALALQRAKPAFISSQRIGVAAGKVFACPVGSQERREYTVVGDIVNLSARLTAICPEDSVLTTAATVDRIGHVIEFECLEPVLLKGKQESVVVYRALGERAAGTTLQNYFAWGQRPLIGRDAELDLLLGGMDAALHGIGGVAAIYGPVGVGKTRLLAAAVDYWHKAGGGGFLGACHPHTADLPFGPWLGVWRDLLGLRPDMDSAAQVTAVINRTGELYPECGDDVGLWSELLGLPMPQAAAVAHLPAEVRQARFFNLVRRCIQGLLAQRPLLIVMEDIHWADQSSLDLIDELAPLVNGRPLYFVLTYRPLGPIGLATLNRPICMPLILSDLPVAEARKLVCSLVGQDILPLVLEQHLGLHAQERHGTLVNPLFLEELLKVMLETGVLEKNGRLHVNEQLLAQMQVPDTVHGLLLARLDRLPAASRDLLQVASVIGRQFGLETLTRITDDTPHDLATALLTDLSEAELTQLIASDPELVYLFQHAMTRDVAYESLPYARRQALHAAIADWLADRYADNLKPIYPLLAYHYSQTDIHEEGLKYALAAANEAKALFANKEAVDLYNLAETHLKALGEEAYWETAVEIYLSRGRVFIFLGDLMTALDDVQKALHLSRARERQDKMAQAYNLLADVKYRQSYFEDVLQLTNELITSLADKISLDELAHAYLWSGLAANALFEHDSALVSLKRAEELCLVTRNEQRLSRVLNAIAFVYFSQQQLDLALPSMERSLQLSERFDTTLSTATALNNMALIQLKLGRVREALRTLDKVVLLARETSQNLLGFALGNRAEVLAYLGLFPDALTALQEALEIFTTVKYDYGLLVTHLVWGYEYCAALANWTEAKNHFDQAASLIQQHPNNYIEEHARLLIGLGQLSLQVGSLAEAETFLDNGLKIIEEKELSWWRAPVHYFKGVVKVRLNDDSAAETLFQKTVQTITELQGCPDYLPLALLELGSLAKNHHTRGRYLESCVRAAQERARYLDRVSCFKLAGAFLLSCEEPHWRKLGEDCQVWLGSVDIL
jgi:adenylate cyclase